jgi:integrase
MLWRAVEPWQRPLGKSWGNLLDAFLWNSLSGFESKEVVDSMEKTLSPTGHLQVRSDRKGGTRSYFAFWRDHHGVRGGKRLGPAHVRDSGRRTPRDAIIWRAGDGPRPTADHLTPKDAEERLDAILAAFGVKTEARKEDRESGTLFQATQGWVAERSRDKGLKRTTLADYESMFERLYRDLGADTAVREFADGRLRDYFDDFKSYNVVGEKTAQKAHAEGKDVQRVKVARWTAQPRDSVPVEVATKSEAVRLADEMPGSWHHLRRGAYRVVPVNAERAKVVTYAQAKILEGEGWIIVRRTKHLWMLVAPAAAQTRNEYRDVFSACLNYAVRQRWAPYNPLVEVKRRSKREERERVLRREDFFDPDEVDSLLRHAPSVFEDAFWLCGAHAGFRLSGEALGLKWGAVDFPAGVIRPYDNWVLGQLDTTKTEASAAIPMTPRPRDALWSLKQRGYATGDEDFVFVDELALDRPARDKPLREAFKAAREGAGLKPIKMYNLRHSFGTSLAAKGVDVRTIQALMRHARLNTTEQYMAYAPRPELANQITRALDPHSLPENVVPIRAAVKHDNTTNTTLLERLEEEVPAKWLREVERILAEGGIDLAAAESTRLANRAGRQPRR